MTSLANVFRKRLSYSQRTNAGGCGPDLTKGAEMPQTEPRDCVG